MRIEDTVLLDAVGFGAFPDTNTDFGLDQMVRTELADKLILYIDSTLNQAVTIQTIAHRRNEGRNLAQVVTVGGSISVAAGDSTPQNDTLTVNLVDNWHRFFGVQISTGAAVPTAGFITVLATTRLLSEDMGEGDDLAQQQMMQLLGEMAQTQAQMNQAIQELLGRPAAVRRGPWPFFQGGT